MTATPGLAQDDVFYFGSAPVETGNTGLSTGTYPLSLSNTDIGDDPLPPLFEVIVTKKERPPLVALRITG